MFVVLRSIWLALADPHALGARPAHVVEDFAGITWHARARSPAFHGLLIGTVELSTELLVLVAAIAHGVGPGPLASAAIPAWAFVQLVVMALAVGWELTSTDGWAVRVQAPRVRLTAHSLRVGRRLEIPRRALRGATARAHGWGPLHRGCLQVAYVDPEGAPRRVVIAADGDDRASLRALADRVQEATLLPGLAPRSGPHYG